MPTNACRISQLLCFDDDYYGCLEGLHIHSDMKIKRKDIFAWHNMSDQQKDWLQNHFAKIVGKMRYYSTLSEPLL